MSREKFITSFDGTELYSRISGEGPPLVLCDGLGCDGFVWKHIEREFGDRYTIIRFHYRGHGLSQGPADPKALDVASLSKDLLAVLDAYDVDKAILAGHSMGVQVILDFALEHPERTAALLPMCGSYGEPLQTFHGNDRAGRSLPYILSTLNRFPRQAQWAWTRLLKTELAYQIATRLELNGKLVRRADFGAYFTHLASMDVGVFFRLVNELNKHSVEDRLSELKIPTLVVAGENDTFTPVWLSHRMHQLIEDSELLVLPSGTHAGPIEIPELVHLRMKNFLDERVAPLFRHEYLGGRDGHALQARAAAVRQGHPLGAQERAQNGARSRFLAPPAGIRSP